MKSSEQDFLDGAAPEEGVWTWGDGLPFHKLGVKFILAQEMLDPLQRHTGLQEDLSQPGNCTFLTSPTPALA